MQSAEACELLRLYWLRRVLQCNTQCNQTYRNRRTQTYATVLPSCTRVEGIQSQIPTRLLSSKHSLWRLLCGSVGWSWTVFCYWSDTASEVFTKGRAAVIIYVCWYFSWLRGWCFVRWEKNFSLGNKLFSNDFMNSKYDSVYFPKREMF